MARNFAMAYSGGKDSILAFHKLIQAGYTPKVLYTVFNESVEGGNHHSLSKAILNRAAESLGMPIEYLDKASLDIYQEVYPTFLSSLKRYDIQYCAFGDIFLEGARRSNTRTCEEAGLTPLFPLWGIQEKEVLDSVIAAGFHGFIKSVDTSRLCGCVLGLPIDDTLVVLLGSFNTSLCGEYGEYHTFVYDGPIFKNRVEFTRGEIVEHKPYQTITLL